jgi:hypothetical protein
VGGFLSVSRICPEEGIAEFDDLHVVNRRITLHRQFGNQASLLQRGQPPAQRRASNANRGKMVLTEGDIEYLET